MQSLNMSRIGLGTVKFGRNTGVKYPQDFELPDDKTLQNLLAIARDHGVNLLDTAPAYGLSEERLGYLIGKKNKEWIIVGKAGEMFADNQSTYDFSPQAIENSVNQSLKHLNRDYLDVLLIHSCGDDLQIIENDDVFNTLNQLKRIGKIRYGGMSTKTIDGGIASLTHADCVMATYNLDYTDEEPVLDFAQTVGKPAFIKKALGSGHLNIDDALRFALEHSGDNHIILGTINPAHLIENLKILG